MADCALGMSIELLLSLRIEQATDRYNKLGPFGILNGNILEQREKAFFYLNPKYKIPAKPHASIASEYERRGNGKMSQTNGCSEE